MLDLVPEQDDQRDRQRDEDDGRGQETESRPRVLAASLDLRPAPCAVQSVRVVDRGRGIDRGILGRGNGVASGLSHRPGILVRPVARNRTYQALMAGSPQ